MNVVQFVKENSILITTLSVLVSFGIVLALNPIVIPLLRRLKFGQTIREEGPKSHQKKSGTPTMGGVIFLFAITVVSCILIFALKCYDIIPVLLLTLGFGLIGLVDDLIIVVKKRNEGLSEIQKFAAQILVTAAFCVYLVKEIGTSITVPFAYGVEWKMPVWLFVIFVFIVVVGTVNGANFTDGLDGLATSVTIVIASFFMIAARRLGFTGNGYMAMSGSVVGSLLGFLTVNSYPASIFMGDTGSLALGGFVAGMACVMRMPLIIILVAFIYLIEVISVMLQVAYFKYTKKKYGEGKRIFRMAPLHHHYQEGGQSETQVVNRFTIITLVLCLVAFLAIK